MGMTTFINHCNGGHQQHFDPVTGKLYDLKHGLTGYWFLVPVPWERDVNKSATNSRQNTVQLKRQNWFDIRYLMTTQTVQVGFSRLWNGGTQCRGRDVNTPAPYWGGPASNLGSQTGWHNWGFSWYSSVPPGECWDSSLKLGHIASFKILSNSSFTYNPIIRR
jgi:hypothetical protein